MKNVKYVSLFLLIFSFALLSSYHIYYYCLEKYHTNLVDNYIYENVNKNNYPQDNVEKKKINTDEKYLGLLLINKINFEKGFYSVDSKMNSVNKGLEILKGSDMPDKDGGGCLFIAAHSGDSYLGYFKHLDQLNINDQIEIYYQNMKYQYVISNVKEIVKNGKISVNKNVHETLLVLTTCSRRNDRQLVITAKLVSTKKGLN